MRKSSSVGDEIGGGLLARIFHRVKYAPRPSCFCQGVWRGRPGKREEAAPVVSWDDNGDLGRRHGGGSVATGWKPWNMLSRRPSANFCGTRAPFMLVLLFGHGLWLSLVERLNGVQEVPGSNPGSPIFRSLGNLLRPEEVRENCGVSEVLLFAGCSRRG